MTDLMNILPVDTSQVVKEAKNSTNKKAGSSLDMTDFLTLMVAMFQNQSMDNTADTGEMMNMMVQMSVVEAISNISTLISDSTTMTYAASLVGKEVTIGQRVGTDILEIRGTVEGTGMLNGQQVVFINGKSYALTEIMAVGKLPDLDEIKPEESGTEPKPDKTEGAGTSQGDEGTSEKDIGGTGVEVNDSKPATTPDNVNAPTETELTEAEGKQASQENAW